MNAKILIYGALPELKSSAVFRNHELIDVSTNPEYELEPGVRYLVIHNDRSTEKTGQAYHWITNTKGIHLGPRREGFYELTKMDYLVTKNGYIFKFIYPKFERQVQWISKAEYDQLSKNIESVRKRIKGASVATGVSKKTGNPWYRLDFMVLSDQGNVRDFLTSEEFIVEPPKLVGHKIIRSNTDIDNSLNYFLATDQLYGIDFETNSFPFDDPEFYPMGLSIVGANGVAAYYDMEWMDSVGGNLEYFKAKLKQFLDAKAEDCYAYNVGFEMRCLFMMFKKVYWLHEASTVNVVEGNNERRYSLKYTAIKALHVPSWDDDFELLSDKLERLMLGDYSGTGKNRTLEREAATIDDYRSHPIWLELMANPEFAAEADEFDRLMRLYWGYSYKCIPSNILGKYCCLDSFYTVLLRKYSDAQGYDDRCWGTYDNNLRMGAILDMSGAHLDVTYRNKIQDTSTNIIISARAIVMKFLMQYFMSLYPEISKIQLDSDLERMLTYNCDPFNTKSWLPRLLSETTDSGLDDVSLERIVGSHYELYQEVLGRLGHIGRSTFRAAKNFYDIESSLLSKYEFSTSGYSTTMLDASGVKVELPYSWSEIKKYFDYKGKLNWLNHLHTQINEHEYECTYNVPDLDHPWNTEVRSVSSDDIMEQLLWIYGIQSPENMSNITYILGNQYYDALVKIHETPDISIQDLIAKIDPVPGYDHYVPKLRISQHDIAMNAVYVRNKFSQYLSANPKGYELLSRWIVATGFSTDSTDPDQVQEEFFSDDWVANNDDYAYRRYMLDHDSIRFMEHLFAKLPATLKPDAIAGRRRLLGDVLTDKIVELASKFLTWYDYDDGTEHKELNCPHEQYTIVEPHITWHIVYDTFEHMNQEAHDYLIEQYYKSDLLEPNILNATIVCLANWMQKKHMKILGTYIKGHLSQYNRVVNPETPEHISTDRSVVGKKYDDNQKIYMPYNVCGVKSKRWSSPYHTIPSKSECKSSFGAPKGHLISYFDISGMEIRAIAYTAPWINEDGTEDPVKKGDPFMIPNYEARIDPYINLAQYLEPGKDISFYKAERPVYKKLLISMLYGMGLSNMCEAAGLTLEAGAVKIDNMKSQMRGIMKMIEDKGDYCENTKGYVKTGLGDKLYVGYEPDRWRRLGINQYVQNLGSVSACDGFFNCVYQSSKPDSGIHQLSPVGVIHDSSQLYVNAKDLFKIHKFYQKHFTEHCKERYFGIEYLFELEFGSNFYDMTETKLIDDTTLEVEGNYTSLVGLLTACNDSGLKFHIEKIYDKRAKADIEVPANCTHLPTGCKAKIKPSKIDQFLDQELEAAYWIDKSKYIIILKSDE